MKNIFLKGCLFLVLVSCKNDNKPATSNQQQTTSNEQQTTSNKQQITGNLIGEWKCVLVTGDYNTNGILDDEEKANGFTTYNDYLKLNPDGTCEYTVAHMNGNYEIVEKDGNKSIEVIVRDGSRIKYGRIISLKPDELQLMKFSGGRDILVYNRP